MLWILPVAGVLVSMVLALAAEYPLVVKITNNFSFKFKSEHVQQWHDCLCAENNTQCVVIHSSRFSVQEIKGPSIGSQCSLNTALYRCDFKIDSVLNITCTRTLTPPDMCLNCHRLCFTNTAPCNVNAVIEVKKDFTVEINDDNMKHCVTPCADYVRDDTVASIKINRDNNSAELYPSNALSNTQIVMNKTKIVITIAVVSSVVIAIISFIIAVCVRIKRKRQVKKTTIDTINLDTGNYLEVYNTGGLYDVSTNTSSLPYLDLLQEPHYHEVDQDRLDPHQLPCLNLLQEPHYHDVDQDRLDPHQLPCLDLLQEPHYHDVDQDRLDPHQLPCLDLLQEPHYHDVDQDRLDPHQLACLDLLQEPVYQELQ